MADLAEDVAAWDHAGAAAVGMWVEVTPNVSTRYRRPAVAIAEVEGGR